ncbi:uncharacterized protein TRIADDRAFT_54505 [Trichoplax adhaerens]|uniref:Uncharacterized protein n=1 Tax=Trichoplax adhaerens TaxID=10228 RepID=B3RS82_TRIAD|nr:hypothetical protein TRIADDRAFT_54505 [Trichoplax adhaerens]EDV26470.1 hypothetical protein TRIADDRAFT_54505 [Trichoplax adhaerens]|eukprot:XP_002110466.1 hypothetical protein TRIADDRAFT_54505 [Trichoplax adhaerens]
MENATSNDPIEGIICPECLSRFDTIDHLLWHFESIHPEIQVSATPSDNDDDLIDVTHSSTGEEQQSQTLPPPKSVSNLIRRIIARGKYRYIGDSYDLDLTYITDRIIVMSIPGEGIHALYRNKIEDVVGLLNHKHGKKYIVFNLSTETYDFNKFDNQVLEFGWPDHTAPPLERLCSICKSMKSWLESDDENVVVVHCKGGKGRTGVVIAAYLQYSKVCSTPEAALEVFKMKRFHNKNGGVTQPSQIRYVGYFHDFISGKMNLHKSPVYLRQVVIHGVPNYEHKGCRPYVTIMDNHSEHPYETETQIITERDTTIRFNFPHNFKLFGDVIVRCYHRKSRASPEIIFRCQFHTAMLSKFPLVLGKHELDDARKDKRFASNIKVEFNLVPSDISETDAPNDDSNKRNSLLYSLGISHEEGTDIDQNSKSANSEENTNSEIAIKNEIERLISFEEPNIDSFSETSDAHVAAVLQSCSSEPLKPSRTSISNDNNNTISASTHVKDVNSDNRLFNHRQFQSNLLNETGLSMISGSVTKRNINPFRRNYDKIEDTGTLDSTKPFYFPDGFSAATTTYNPNNPFLVDESADQSTRSSSSSFSHGQHSQSDAISSDGYDHLYSLPIWNSPYSPIAQINSSDSKRHSGSFVCGENSSNWSNSLSEPVTELDRSLSNNDLVRSKSGDINYNISDGVDNSYGSEQYKLEKMMTDDNNNKKASTKNDNQLTEDRSIRSSDRFDYEMKNDVHNNKNQLNTSQLNERDHRENSSHSMNNLLRELNVEFVDLPRIEQENNRSRSRAISLPIVWSQKSKTDNILDTQDMSMLVKNALNWYKPTLSQKEVTDILGSSSIGSFVVRDSTSFKDAFDLAIKSGFNKTEHFLIEPVELGVQIKGYDNEPAFCSLSALIQQHTLTSLALPCKLSRPESAFNVMYLGSINVERVNDSETLNLCISKFMSYSSRDEPIPVSFKASLEGVTLTDVNKMQSDVLNQATNNINPKKLQASQHFGFVTKDVSQLFDTCWLFTDIDPSESSSTIAELVNFLLPFHTS